MAIAEELQVIIDAKVQDAVRDMKKVDKSLGQAEQSTKKMSASMSKALKTIGGFAAAAVSIGAITKAVKASVDAFRVQEEAEAQLRGALLATGKAADGTAEELQALASELQGVTTFGDEATIQATGLLQSLADLDKDGLKQIIPRVQDFATGMGIDLTNAAQLVGKTLSSSTNALVRYGVEIDASASKSEKLDQLTAALDSKFGGLSQEMANTASGGLTQLNNAFGDLQEMIGEKVLERMGGLIGRLTNFIEKTIQTREQINALNDALADDGGEDSLQTQVETLEEMRDSARANIENYKEQFGSLEDMNHIQQQIVKSEQDRLERANSQLTIKRQLLDFERRAAAGQEALAEQEQRRQERMEAFNEASEYANQLAEQREDPVKRELDAVNSLIASLAEKRDLMRQTGDWTQANQDVINALYRESVRLQEELNEKMSEQGETVRTVGRMWDSLTSSSVAANAITQEATEQTRQSIIQMTDEAQARFDALASGIQGVMTELGSFLSAVNAAQMQDFRNSQEEQIEALEERRDAGIISEEEYQKQKQKLEDETQKKIAEAQKRAAQQQKAIAIFQSITNTAVAVTKALAQSANPVLAGIIGGLGAAQTALIAAQPIPEFATGGSFETNGPQTIRVGDNPGGRERVTVEPTSSSIGGGSQPMGGDVYLDGRKVGEWIQSQTAKGQIRIAERAVV